MADGVVYLVPHAEPDRVLASIRRVHSVVKHPQADRLSLLNISVLGQPDEACGWQMVFNHEQTHYMPGDLVVYVEIDAVLPMDRPEFEFLREKSKGRVKTLALRGELSQGLVFPLALLPDPSSRSEGDDVTHLLGLRKFVPPEERDSYTTGGSGIVKFPSQLCQRTEEIRLQNTNLADWGEAASDVMFTEKLHGTSATYIFDAEGRLTHVCSRNVVRAEDDSVWWLVARRLQKVLTEEKSREEFQALCPVVLQGEICGPQINENLYQLTQPELYLFTTSGLEFNRHTRAQTEHIARVLGQSVVPMVADHVDLRGLPTKQILMDYAEGQSLLNPKALREGVVGRSNVVCRSKFSFKAINNIWLCCH